MKHPAPRGDRLASGRRCTRWSDRNWSRHEVIAIHPLTGIGEVIPGSDLPQLLVDALNTSGLELHNDDVLVVTQKIISKSENRFIELDAIEPSNEANRLATITGKEPRFVEAVLAESTEVVRTAPNVLITRHRLGFIMA